MGITHIRRYCLEGGQQEQTLDHIHILANDYRQFQKDRWYTFQNPILFDTNKFIFLYPNYEEEQTRLLHRWNGTIDIKTIEYGQSRNEEDVVSTRWKYAIKRGVPIEYYKVIISVMYNTNFQGSKTNYQKIKNQANFNQPTPLFGHEEVSLRQAVTAPFLNERGWAVLKELMHLFKKKKGDNFYNKYIGHITALLLIFFDDSQTYELMATMMDQSLNNTINRVESLRWHLVFKEQQMKNNLASNFYRIVSNNSPTVANITKNLQKNNIDKIKLFYRVIQNFFYSYLPFPFILRIFIIFLNEGVKIFFRIFYVMIVYSQEQLKKANSLEKACLVLKKKCLGLSTVQSYAMLKSSYNLNLKATVSLKLFESRLKKQQNQRRYYYLPIIEGISNIISYQDLQMIWSFLPFQLKTYDLQVKYPLETTKPDELHLSDLLKSIKDQKFSLILVRTTCNEAVNVFGCFIADKISAEEKQDWYGSNQSFIFTLHPQPKKYLSTRQNNYYFQTTKKCFKIGFGGNGSALVLHDELIKGESYRCNTFRNEPLNGGVEGQFQLDWIEAFTIF